MAGSLAGQWEGVAEAALAPVPGWGWAAGWAVFEPLRVWAALRAGAGVAAGAVGTLRRRCLRGEQGGWSRTTECGKQRCEGERHRRDAMRTRIKAQMRRHTAQGFRLPVCEYTRRYQLIRQSLRAIFAACCCHNGPARCTAAHCTRLAVVRETLERAFKRREEVGRDALAVERF